MLGEKIKTARKLKHLTIEQITKKLGISKYTYYQYENGTIQNIPLERLESIAQILDIPLGQLIDNDNLSQLFYNDNFKVDNLIKKINDPTPTPLYRLIWNVESSTALHKEIINLILETKNKKTLNILKEIILILENKKNDSI